jgi:spore maturation protein CgeB
MGHEVELFDYMGVIRSSGKMQMNQTMLERVAEWKPDIALFSLYTDQFEPDAVLKLRSLTQTLCFFHDDTWRESYSKFWARHFDYFTTPDPFGLIKYHDIGMNNAIHFPFGCNEDIFRDLSLPKKYDVSFVGGWHPYREWLVNRLGKAGIQVATFGHRWPNGIVDQEAMVGIFNESKINLNLTNSASWDIRYLLASPRGLVDRLRSSKTVEQLKARPFELGGCGAFQLTYYVAGLENYYALGRELAVYIDPDDLLDKIVFYLKHDDLRNSIAAAAYAKTRAQHTFRRRFEHVFDVMGLTSVTV